MRLPPLSVTYMVIESTICLQLLMHWMSLALALARLSAGSNMAAKIAMIAITTSNSMRVNA